MQHKAILILVTVLFIIGIIFLVLTEAFNSAITKEENVNTALSNISKEEKRRVDLFNNLVDAVQSYNKFEKDTLKQVIEARAQANAGNVESANLMLAAVVEAYPQLKAQENYKQAMLEFSITENRLSGYREQYNNEVRAYNRSVRTFPNRIFLSFIGYQPMEYQYLDYKVNNAQAVNLFDNEQ